MNALTLATSSLMAALVSQADDLPSRFASPPDSARPGVYWYFMDGNLSREGMTRDLESMRAAGLGHLVFLEVDVGVPRGPIGLLSEAWQEHFVHAVREAERLGIEITMGSGPGWAGSGGPWVKPEQSMQHLVASQTEVEGPARFEGTLPVPPPRRPFFGDVPPPMRTAWESFFKDVAVLAFPTPRVKATLPDVDEKALYYRAPFSSQPGVKPFLEAPAEHPSTPEGSAIAPSRILDLTGRLKPDGTLDWEIPEGQWTILRLVSRNNGASTRPAPEPGIGFECDKFEAAAFDAHFDAYLGRLLEKVGRREKDRGWTMIHIDSWEMGAQNWTPRFREEFRLRRGYDPQPYYPAYLGYLVGDRERTERFLWDLRITGQELVIENHAGRFKALGREHGFTLSIEPYDMNPTSDFDLGAVADVPMCEFWSQGFDTTFSCHEASSIAHILGRPVVAAEAFTANPGEDWKFHPGHLKNQGDWAFATGINRLTYHTFAHKPDETRPGMVMGPYGVHWDRGQTWWPMVADYHRYITRCQHLLREGRTVADVLYLLPEGAPHVFQPPPSALSGSPQMPDRRGYNFDACSPSALLALAGVRDGQVVFPSGAAYRLLVLPDVPTMTPELVTKLEALVKAGAVLVGPPPRKSPSLVNHPACDQDVARVATALWGTLDSSAETTHRRHGLGRVFNVCPPRSSPSDARLLEARWIWNSTGEPAQSAPVGTLRFQREFTVDSPASPLTARLEMTADNGFSVSLNGAPLGEGGNFHQIYTFDLLPALRSGTNRLTVRAVNGGDAPNPAGLIASLHLTFSSGPERLILTDEQWQVASADADDWKPARVLGPAGMAPWNLTTPTTTRELYPRYDLTAGILRDLGVVEDFSSPGPVRYTHRHTTDREIFFVANRSAQPVTTSGTFRVSGRTPELWNPRTGQSRALADFSASEGRTTVPLRFEPFESFFVIFPTPDAALDPAPVAKPNFTEPTVLGALEGAWDVAFDPAMGGPERVRFDALDDWSTRPEPGIRYYSGIATYRKTFDLPQGTDLPPGSKLHLDLGEVQVMARVRVNGQDCGVAWTAPWRVDISNAVQAAGNTVEVEVANLWPNRMIGDARSPGQTFARTTYRPYQATHPLLPSGLRGPVRLMNVPK